MEPDRRHQVSDLYHAALERAPGERPAFLEQACGGDEALRKEVASLLGYEPEVASFLETPAAVVASHGVADMVGRQLGPYRILSPLGAGGMGEVYRARDSALRREVAIKILPSHFTADPERIGRFRREAQVLASLNHPHIGAIYGLDEANNQQFLVLELIDGETLAARIAKGPLPVDDALGIARQIAEGLEAAHEKGIVHRDLKPANIALTHDGTVKVLDFGLAKATESASSSHDPASSPTLTSPAMMTSAGMILGTAAYMSPEQAKGRAADKRTDVWAFGCVVYEMLTGRRAFAGEDLPDTIAAVMRGEADWSAMPSGVPPHIVTLVKGCLEKDRNVRIGDLAVARFVLAEPGRPSAAVTAFPALQVVPQPNAWRGRLPWAVAAGALVLATSAVGLWAPWRKAPAPRTARFTVGPTGTLPLVTRGPYRDLAFSPDGTHLVYVAGPDGPSKQLWVRSINQVDAVQLRGLNNPNSPFFSPDSEWIGFVTANDLMKVSMSGGPPIPICPIQGGSLRGASWGRDDMIVFATAVPATGLFIVPSGGGDPKVLTTPDPKQLETGHLFPSVLPGGQVLFTITTTSGPDNTKVAVLDRQTGVYRTLIPGGGHAEYMDPSTSSGQAPSTSSGQAGYLIYAAGATLRAVRFDPDRLEVLSGSVPVVEQVLTKASGAAEFSVSRNGGLVYMPGGPGTGLASRARTLVWVDRHGREEPIEAPPREYQVARLSPDRTRIAVDARDQEGDIWTWDLLRKRSIRITTDPGLDVFPVWTKDSLRILFASARAGVTNLYWQAADGTGKAEPLTTSPNDQLPLSLSRAGTQVIVRGEKPQGGPLLLLLHLDALSTALGANPATGSGTGKRLIEPLTQTSFNEDNGVISADGHWLAYESNQTGQYEVYVRPFSNATGGPIPVSSGGGRSPLWAPNGRELFYRDGAGRMTTVPVQTSPTFTYGRPTTLFEKRYFTAQVRTYDVSADSQKFLMIENVPSADQRLAPGATMEVVLNWVEELKARVPAK